MRNIITDHDINLTPLVHSARANKDLILAYNIDQSIRSSRNRKLRKKKRHFKPVRNNTINYLNSKIERRKVMPLLV